MSKPNFKERFKDKISVVNKDGSSTHVASGAVTMAPVAVARTEPSGSSGPLNQRLKEQLSAQLEQRNTNAKQGSPSTPAPNTSPFEDRPAFQPPASVETKPPQPRPEPRPKPQSFYHALRAQQGDAERPRDDVPMANYAPQQPQRLRDAPQPLYDDLPDDHPSSDDDVPTFGCNPNVHIAKPGAAAAPAVALTLKQQQELKAKGPKGGRRAGSQPVRGPHSGGEPSAHFIPDPVSSISHIPPQRVSDLRLPPVPLRSPPLSHGLSAPPAEPQARPHQKDEPTFQEDTFKDGSISPASYGSSDRVTPPKRQPASAQQVRPAVQPGLPRRRARSIDVSAGPEAQPKGFSAYNYTPYTIEDFKKINQVVKMSALGYVETEEKIKGRELKMKMREYSQGVRHVNQPLGPIQLKPIVPPPKPEKDQAMQMRQKAMEFASKVPKPRAKPAPHGPGQRDDEESAAPGGEVDHLAALEWQHQLDQEEVQAIKRQLKL